jgi:hypothetical protein
VNLALRVETAIKMGMIFRHRRKKIQDQNLGHSIAPESFFKTGDLILQRHLRWTSLKMSFKS